MVEEGRERESTHPGFLIFHTKLAGVTDDSSTTGFQSPFSSLAVMVLIEEVNTTRFTVPDLMQDCNRFLVPHTAGSRMFLLT